MEPPDEAGRPLFVETTIHIWRHTTPNAVKRRINNTLKQRYSITSTYVKAEYINTFLRAGATIYNVLLDSDDIEDALGRWENQWGSQYKLGVRSLFSVVLKGADDKEAALRRLRQMIEVTYLAWFEDSIKEIVDPTDCEAAHRRPHFNGTYYELPPKFPSVDAPAGLRDFLTRYQPFLERLRESLSTERDEHWEKIQSSLNTLIEGQFTLKLTDWQRLSDVVIALEADWGKSELYSGNLKHFRVICQVIELLLKEEHPK